PHVGLLQAATTKPVLTYSRLNPAADLFVERLTEAGGRLDFRLVWQGQSADGQLLIPGSFNIENLMAALLTVSRLLGRSPLELVPLTNRLVAVKGRMCAVRAGQPFEVLIDYAHTPGAYEKILPAVKAGVQGRLITVFGSAGERDHDKRPLQGALADRWSDVIVLTDEDPRQEGSQPILDEIAAGIQHKVEGETLFQVTPRPAALEWAFDLARPGDTVLLLGKGHEQSIIYAHGSEKYDEEAVAKALLIRAGYQL
ncbi:MAG: cyanophycin synthetase, partial [Desulfovibrionaceae bacterium]|nr:cyanophycin synthetase [Desulfovibrionaceae bacterium]